MSGPLGGPVLTGSPCMYCRHALLLRPRSLKSSGRDGACGACAGVDEEGVPFCSEGKEARGGFEMDDCHGRDGPASGSDAVGDEGLRTVKRRCGLGLGVELGEGCAFACPFAFRTVRWRFTVLV